MEKRYQVFVSSTFSDLKEERQQVIKIIMTMDCIPAGMEMFPASDDEQFEFIKKVIDDCDYYILIIGGRYGSLTNEGISYTEKEYEYAIEKKLPVLGFVHGSPEKISVEKSDIDRELRIKLGEFRNKVCGNKLNQMWYDSKELPGLVAVSLSKVIKMYPRIGWVRGSTMSNEDLLDQINVLRIENQNISKKLNDAEKEIDANRNKEDNLAKEEDVFLLKGKYYSSKYSMYESWSKEITWNTIFSYIGPYLFEPNSDLTVRTHLEKVIRENHSTSAITLDDDIIQTIKIQLLSLGLIDVYSAEATSGGVVAFWILSPYGKNQLKKIKTIKKLEC